MLTVETIARIRREHFIKGKTIREIARDLKVSRNTVRKVLRSGETSFEYERDVQPRPRLGRWMAELDELLAGNAAKSAREQLTLIRIFEELRGRGYEGGYDAVRRYARRWAKERGQATAAAYVPLSFAPGEAYQFDWSHEVVLLSGVTVIVKAAHVRLCHSRMLFVRVYTAKTSTTGGRENGASRSSDGVLDIRLSTPGSARIGTNPEQLFAAGWSASFESAIGLAARKRKITLPADVAIDAEVDLNLADGGYFLRARLNVSLPGVERDVAQALVDEAHQICPYSKATRGNIDVVINLV